MKLEGMRVLDLSLFLPGPHLTMMMADHGAEVVKVEPPSGEPVREVGLKQAGVSTWFRNTHRGKRCIVLDLKSEAGHAASEPGITDALVRATSQMARRLLDLPPEEA